MNGQLDALPAEIAKRSGSNFLVAFARLEPARKAALTAIYAFCRVVDDAVDDAPDAAQGARRLAAWEDELRLIERGQPATAIGREVARAIANFGVDPRHLRRVVEGVAEDLRPHRYPDLAALEEYCAKVASAVGLACLPVFGATGAEPYADSLGKALQLTNILRDLVPDATLGRVYVPDSVLRAHQVEAAWLDGKGPAAAYRVDGPVHGVVRELAAAAHAHFAAAAATFPRGEAARLRAPQVMAAVYRDLLQRVELRGGDLRQPRPRVPQWKKLWLAWTAARA